MIVADHDDCTQLQRAHGRAGRSTVVFIIKGLGTGGAELQLIALLERLDRKRFTALLVILGSAEPELMARTRRIPGVRVIPIRESRMRRILHLRRGMRFVRNLKPRAVYGILTGGMIAARLLCLCLPRSTRLVIGVRCSNWLETGQASWLARVGFRVGALSSCRADLAIANSEAGREYFQARGYSPAAWTVIPNGVDAERFRPIAEERTRIRAFLGADDSTALVGMIARMDGVKDYETFLRSAALARHRTSNLRFICVGREDPTIGEFLRSLAQELGIAGALTWLGLRTDMPSIYNALDVCVLSSKSEGFPNVLIEAMACGVYCVASDVGDAKIILHNCGVVVPTGDPGAMADAIGDSVCWQARTEAARQLIRDSVVSRFALEKSTAAMQSALFG